MQRPDQTWTQGQGFIPAIIGLTSRWRLAVRAKGPLAEDDMGERWNWNESAQQLTTQDSGIQNATKAQTIVDFSTAHRTRNTLAARIWFPLKNTCFHYFSYFHFVRQKRSKKKRNKKENKENIFWPQETFSQLKTKCRLQYPTGAKTKRKKEKKRKKGKKKQRNKKEKEKKQKETNRTKCHRYAISTQSPLCNSCLENGSQKSCCSDL